MAEQGIVTEADLVEELQDKISPGILDLDVESTAGPLNGRIKWNPDKKCPEFYNDITGVSLQMGRELWVRAYNNTGAVINNGQVVYMSGAFNYEVSPGVSQVIATIALSRADDYDRSGVLAVCTEDIANNSVGEVTRFGEVNEIDTSAFGQGDVLYLKAGTFGGLTNVRPTFPAKPIHVGHCLESAVSGSMIVVINPDNYDYEFDGCAVEQQNMFIVVSGTAVYAEVVLEDTLRGKDVPIQIGGQVFQLDCSSGAGTDGRARVALTQGTATAGQRNWLYVEIETGVATLKSATTRPSGMVAPLGECVVWDYTKTTADGPKKLQRYTDAIEHKDQGRIRHISDKIRTLGTTEVEGCAATAYINDLSPDEFGITTVAGTAWQMHKQTWPTMDIAVNGIFVANASGDGALVKDQKIFDLFDALETTDGTPISGRRAVFFIWGAINKTTGDCKLFLNLPTDTYGTNASAYEDTAGTAPPVVESDMFSVAFGICKFPFRHRTLGGGTIAYVNPTGLPKLIDMRAVPMNSSAGGAVPVGGATTFAALTDTEFDTPLQGQVAKYDIDGVWRNYDENTDAESIHEVPIELIEETEDNITGVDIVTNGNFDTDLTGWLALDSAVLTWQTGGYMRVAYGGVTDPRSYQVAGLEAGKTYQVTAKVRSDGSALPRISDSGSGMLWTGTNSTDWQEIQYTGVNAGGNLLVRALTSIAGYIEIDYISIRELRTVPTTDKKLNAITRENLLLQSEDISASPWGSSRMIVGSINQYTPSTSTGAHYYLQTETHNEGDIVGIIVKVKAENLDYFWFGIGGIADYFNIKLGLVGTSNLANSSNRTITLGSDGYAVIRLDLSWLGSLQTLQFGVAESDNVQSFTGDAVTIACTIKSFQTHTSSSQDNIGYIKTTTAAYPRALTFEVNTDKQLKWDAGFVQRADALSDADGWMLVGDVNGIQMDGSPGNILALRQAELYEATATGAWGPLVAGTQFWANDNSDNFVELFEASAVTLSNTNTIYIDGTAPTGKTVVPLHVKEGYLFPNDQYDAITVPSYLSSSTFAQVRPLNRDDTSFRLLVGANFVTTDMSYRMVVQYNYVALPYIE